MFDVVDVFQKIARYLADVIRQMVGQYDEMVYWWYVVHRLVAVVVVVELQFELWIVEIVRRFGIRMYLKTLVDLVMILVWHN
jgi:hypothetical protein